MHYRTLFSTIAVQTYSALYHAHYIPWQFLSSKGNLVAQIFRCHSFFVSWWLCRLFFFAFNLGGSAALVSFRMSTNHFSQELVAKVEPQHVSMIDSIVKERYNTFEAGLDSILASHGGSIEATNNVFGQGLHALQQAGVMCDVAIIAQGRTFHAHKIVLAGASSSLGEYFDDNCFDGITCIELQLDASALAVEVMLRHIYSRDDQIEWPHSACEVEEIVKLAEAFNLAQLCNAAHMHLPRAGNSQPLKAPPQSSRSKAKGGRLEKTLKRQFASSRKSSSGSKQIRDKQLKILESREPGCAPLEVSVVRTSYVQPKPQELPALRNQSLECGFDVGNGHRCDYLAYSATTLACHRRVTHGLVVPHRAVVICNQCPYCEITFSNAESARQHVQARMRNNGWCPVRHKSPFALLTELRPPQKFSC